MWTQLAGAAVILGLIAATASAQPPLAPPANDDCLACHGDAGAKRNDGRTIAVDATSLAASMHGPLACVDCHADLVRAVEFPHDSAAAPRH